MKDPRREYQTVFWCFQEMRFGRADKMMELFHPYTKVLFFSCQDPRGKKFKKLSKKDQKIKSFRNFNTAVSKDHNVLGIIVWISINNKGGHRSDVAVLLVLCLKTNRFTIVRAKRFVPSLL